MNKKFIKLVNNERISVKISSQKGCIENSYDVCKTSDNERCYTYAYDWCNKDYAACREGAEDVCTTIDRGYCSAAGAEDTCDIDYTYCSGFGEYDIT